MTWASHKSVRAAYVLGLTGTPAPNGVRDLYPQNAMLRECPATSQEDWNTSLRLSKKGMGDLSDLPEHRYFEVLYSMAQIVVARPKSILGLPELIRQPVDVRMDISTALIVDWTRPSTSRSAPPYRGFRCCRGYRRLLSLRHALQHTRDPRANASIAPPYLAPISYCLTLKLTASLDRHCELRENGWACSANEVYCVLMMDTF